MKLTIEGTAEEIKKALQAIASSEEREKSVIYYGAEVPELFRNGDLHFKI